MMCISLGVVMECTTFGQVAVGILVTVLLLVSFVVGFVVVAWRAKR